MWRESSDQVKSARPWLARCSTWNVPAPIGTRSPPGIRFYRLVSPLPTGRSSSRPRESRIDRSTWNIRARIHAPGSAILDSRLRIDARGLRVKGPGRVPRGTPAWFLSRDDAAPPTNAQVGVPRGTSGSPRERLPGPGGGSSFDRESMSLPAVQGSIPTGEGNWAV
jgi:hypothetical protein